MWRQYSIAGKNQKKLFFLCYNDAMDDHDRQLLNKTYELLKENTRMTAKLYRAEKSSRIFRMLYWVIIIGSMLGAYYYIEPYLQKMGAVYTDGNNLFNSINGASGTPTTQDAVKGFFTPKTPAETTTQ